MKKLKVILVYFIIISMIINILPIKPVEAKSAVEDDSIEIDNDEAIVKEKPLIISIKNINDKIKVKWSELNSNKGYEIKINNRIYKVDSNEFEYPYFKEIENTTITVRAVYDTGYSYWSDEEKIETTKETITKNNENSFVLSSKLYASANEEIINTKIDYFVSTYSNGKWQDKSSNGYDYGTGVDEIEKFKITSKNKPSGAIMKYQAYIYDKSNKKGKWQEVKTEGEEAGEIGKIITSIKIWLDGVDYDPLYYVTGNNTEEKIYVSDIVRNGDATDSTGTNKIGITNINFRIVEGLPKVQVETCSLEDNEWTSVDNDNDGFLDNNGKTISKIKMSNSKQKYGVKLKYQVYIKENNAWSDVKSDGEIAGEDGKTITNIRAEIEGADGCTIRYRFKTYESNEDVKISNYGSDFKEPINELTNTNKITGIFVEVCRLTPKIMVFTYGNVSGKNQWSTNETDGRFGYQTSSIKKMFIKLYDGANETKVCYQVRSKDGIWDEWKSNGEITGTDGFTSLRVKLDGDTFGKSIEYNIASSITDERIFISENGFNGIEPLDSLTNNKDICSIYINIFSQEDYSKLDLSKNEIKIDNTYVIPEGKTLSIPAGKKLIYDYSKTNTPGFIVKGNLIFEGNDNNKISVIDEKGSGKITVENSGSLTLKNTEITSKSKYNSDVLIDNNGKTNIENSKFTSTNKYREAIENNGTNNLSIKNSNFENWAIAISISGNNKGNVEIENCNINNNQCGILVCDGNGYSKDNSIKISKSNINTNDIAIFINRVGEEILHKTLEIESNTLDGNKSYGILINSDKIGNINITSNTITNTNSNMEPEITFNPDSIIKGGPIFIMLYSLEDSNKVLIENTLSKINSSDIANMNTLKGNNIDDIIMSGVLNNNINLNLNNGKYSYVFDSNMGIVSGAVLNISDGTKIKLCDIFKISGELNIGKSTITKLDYNKSKGYSIIVSESGRLNVKESIFENGGMTDGSNKLATIQTYGDSTLSNCSIRNKDKLYTGIIVWKGNPTISGVTIEGADRGIEIQSSTQINKSTIKGCNSGIMNFATQGDAIIISACTIQDNLEYGVGAYYHTEIYDSTIKNSKKKNIIISSDKINSTVNASIMNSTIINSITGIGTYYKVNLTVQYCNIYGTEKAIDTMFLEGGKRVDARYNYWGSKMGPSLLNRRWNPYTNRYEDDNKINNYTNYTGNDFTERNYIYYNNTDFEPAYGQKVTGIDLGLNEDKINKDVYDYLESYSYNLKKSFTEEGVSPVTGNYSKQYEDLKVDIGTAAIDISRYYNSGNSEKGLLGEGWTFYYEAGIKDIKNEDSEIDQEGKIVTLPGMVSCTFTESEKGKYSAVDNRNTLTTSNGNFILKTREGVSYKFDSNGKLNQIISKEGNNVFLKYNNDLLSQINDECGREYKIKYSDKLIECIEEYVDGKLNRSIKYNYNSNKLLESVTDANGNIQEVFYYDKNNKLEKIIRDGIELEKVTYSVDKDNNYRINNIIDSNGNEQTYIYDDAKRTTTIKDKNNKSSQLVYDKNYCVVDTIDIDNYVSHIDYSLDKNNKNIFGEEKAIRDQLGNNTTFFRDERGNITSEVYCDNSRKIYKYDDNNNLILEKTKEGNSTYYEYDDNNLLIRIIVPLNGVDEYSADSDESKFAITEYKYYEVTDTNKIKGLVKEVKNPNNTKKSYTYDKFGNILTETDELGNTIKYTYDKSGNMLTQKNSNDAETTYTYDKKGNKLTEKDALGNVQEWIYDANDRVISEIDPKKNIKKKYTYTNSDLIKTEEDSLGNVITYTYDIYGNKIEEKNELGGIYYYSYDSLGRVLEKSYKESDTSNKILLEENRYESVEEYGENKTIKNTKTYIDENNYRTTVTKYNFYDEITDYINPEGSRIKNIYTQGGNLECMVNESNIPTYYRYDVFGNVTDMYEAVKEENSNIKYKHTKYIYDKVGNKKCEKIGLDLVNLDEEAKEYFVTNYVYDKSGEIIEENNSDGARIKYSYDKLGNLISKEEFIDSTRAIVTEYVYDANNRLTEEKLLAYKCDIEGYSDDNTDKIYLTTSNSYDKNGNIIKTTYPDGSKIEYTYDNLDRVIQKKESVINADNEYKYNISKYSYYGSTDNIKEFIDPCGNSTSYTYKPNGELVELNNPDGSSIEYINDLTGNTISEISYDSNKTIKRTINKVYDVRGREILKSVDVRDGESIVLEAYQYDERGNVIKEVDGENYKNSNGQTIDEKIKNASGTEYTFTMNNLMETMLSSTSKISGDSFTKKYSYNLLGGLIQEEDIYGNKTKYTLDNRGNVLSKSYVNNSNEIKLQENTYDKLGNLISTKDGNGNVTKYTINSIGKVKTLTMPSDSSISAEKYSFKYNKVGNVSLKTYSNGLIESIVTDYKGNVVSKKSGSDSSSILQKFYYDGNGNLVKNIDANGNIITNTYDKMGNKTSISINNVVKNSYDYDCFNNIISETDRFGNTVKYNYDNAGRLKEKIDAFGEIIEKLEYYDNGCQAKSIDTLGNVIEYKYDTDKRLIETIDKENNSSKKEYDKLNNIISEIDSYGNKTRYKYDGLGRLVSVTNALLEETSYKYDANNNLTEVKDGKGNITTYKYNSANLQSSIIAPNSGSLEGKIQQYVYNSDGSIKKVTDRNGNTISYEYDIFGRKIKETNGNNIIKYSYDNIGNLTKVIDSGETTIYKYDDENRVIEKSAVGKYKLNYQYDLNNQKGSHEEKIIDDKNGTIVKTYDKMGKITGLNTGSGNISFTYYKNGAKKETIYPDNSRQKYTYTKNNSVETIEDISSNGTVENTYLYKYDDNENIILEKNNKDLKLYKYDAVNRLSSEILSGGMQVDYSYDKSGNRISQEVSSSEGEYYKEYSYDEENRLISTTELTGEGQINTQYKYDNNGNMLSELSKNEDTKKVTKDRKLSYDNYNRLIKVTDNDKTVEKNEYDYTGLRTKKVVDDKVTNYIYDGTDAIIETDENNNVSARNYFTTEIISRVNINNDQWESGYYKFNGHADVTKIISSTGQELATYDYDSFGNIISETGEFNNPYRYSGYVYDEEIDYYYLRARMYSPELGRFIQEDTYRGEPKDPLSLNLYTYCNNNPLIYNDPTGHWPKFIKKAANAVKKAAVKVAKVTTSAVKGIVKGAYEFVKETVVGICNTVKNIVVGTYKLITDPVNTVKSMAKSVKNAYNTAKYLYNNPGVLIDAACEQYKAFKNASLEEKFKMGTKLVLNSIPSTSVLKAGKVSSIANKFSKFSKVASKIKKESKVVKSISKVSKFSSSKGSIIKKATSKVDNVVSAVSKKSNKVVSKANDVISTASKKSPNISKTTSKVDFYAAPGGTVVKGSDYITDSSRMLKEGVSKPDIGKKLEYVFGNATGNKHNIERSLDMENKLNKIGIFDNAKGRTFMENELQKTFNNTTNGILQENGRIMKESLLTGPNGVAKMQSVWDGDRLITVEIFKSDWKSFVKQ